MVAHPRAQSREKSFQARRHNFLDLCSKIRTGTRKRHSFAVETNWSPFQISLDRLFPLFPSTSSNQILSPPVSRLTIAFFLRAIIAQTRGKKVSISYPFFRSAAWKWSPDERRAEERDKGWDEDVKLDHRCVSGVCRAVSIFIPVEWIRCLGLTWTRDEEREKERGKKAT